MGNAGREPVLLQWLVVASAAVMAVVASGGEVLSPGVSALAPRWPGVFFSNNCNDALCCRHQNSNLRLWCEEAPRDSYVHLGALWAMTSMTSLCMAA
jgi:hypothetical protein